MNRMKRFVLFTLALTLTLLHGCKKKDSLELTTEYFESIRSDSAALKAFFDKMPKGGELHYHAIGSNFAENLIDVAVDHGCFINPQDHTLYRSKDQAINQVIPDENVLPIAIYLNQDPENERKIIEAWSMLNYEENDRNGHDWFFGTFFKFKEAFFVNTPRCLSLLTERAAKENVQYLEAMINVPEVNERALQIGDGLGMDDVSRHKIEETLEEWYTLCLEMGMDSLVNANIDSLKAYRERTDFNGVEMNFMAYGLRIYPLLQHMFAETMLNFATASKSDLMVGVNLVAPEDNPIALELYEKHMFVFGFLASKYPGAKISLHSGELVPCLPGVDSSHLRDHIFQAIFYGHADRVGHGVDMLYEAKATKVLGYMAANHIAAEINLRSNEVILGTKPATHPVNLYLNADVPVALSTDDAGILRTDLAAQYHLLTKYSPELTYAQIKGIVRNSIEYSFASIEQKEKMLTELDERFLKFEEEMAETIE